MNQNINSIRKDILVMKVQIGETEMDLTFDKFFFSKESKQMCSNRGIASRSRKISGRPFIDRFRPYSTRWLNDLCYEDLVHFFFDENVFFNEPSYFGSPVGDVNDDAVIRQNIYLTLFYLFPTGFPIMNNIVFSFDTISGQKSFSPMLSGYYFTDFGNSKEPLAITDGGDANTSVTPVTPVKEERKSESQSLLSSFFSAPYRRYSYIGSASKCDYTVSQVTWKNDIYNHPSYVELLSKVYSLCVWQQTTGKVEFQRLLYGAGQTSSNMKNGYTAGLHVRLKQQLDSIHKNKLESLKKLTKHAIHVDDHIIQNQHQFISRCIDFLRLSKDKKYTVPMAKYKADGDNKYKKYNKLYRDIRKNNNESEFIKARAAIQEYLSEYVLVFYNLLSSYKTDSKNVIDRREKLLHSYSKIQEEIEQREEEEEKDQAANNKDVEFSTINQLKQLLNSDGNEEMEAQIIAIYKNGDIRTQIEKLFKDINFTFAKESIQNSSEIFMDTFTQYVVYTTVYAAILDFKMINIDDFIPDNEFMKIINLQKGSLLGPFYDMRKAYFKFMKETGESTNADLNGMITDYMIGKTNDLGLCSIYYHNVMLKSQTDIFNDIGNYESEVSGINSSKKIYTGIRKDVSTLSKLYILDGISEYDTPALKTTTEYVVHISLNVYDQELNNENVSGLKCFLLGTELGRRLNNLVYLSEESVNKYLVFSEIKHIPRVDGKDLNELAKASDSKEKEKEKEGDRDRDRDQDKTFKAGRRHSHRRNRRRHQKTKRRVLKTRKVRFKLAFLKKYADIKGGRLWYWS